MRNPLILSLICATAPLTGLAAQVSPRPRGVKPVRMTDTHATVGHLATLSKGTESAGSAPADRALDVKG